MRFVNRSKKKGDDNVRRDNEKSAELIAELSAGAPAALILASAFQKDEKDKHRLPVLFEQLKIAITDSSRTDDRQHTTFRIELEYGSGFSRMKWVVHRDFRDFVNLHSRLRVIELQHTIYPSGGAANHKHHELPHFPKNAIPYLRGVRGLNSSYTGNDNLIHRSTNNSNNADIAEESELPSMPGLLRPAGPSRGATSSRHSFLNFLDDSGAPNNKQAVSSRNIKFAEMQRQTLEEYLKSLIRYMIFRGTANRLCKFLEFSAMGLRLSGEKSYHGKEGPLTIISTSHSQGWRTRNLKPSNIKAMFNRHSSKWFLVRHSYLVIVDSIAEVTPTDVFLVDEDFKFTHNELGFTGVQNKAKLRFTIKLSNSERKIKLLARSEKHLNQWMDSLNYMNTHTQWSSHHRFSSFAPIRYNVNAQWFVDGVWNLLIA